MSVALHQNDNVKDVKSGCKVKVVDPKEDFHNVKKSKDITINLLLALSVFNTNLTFSCCEDL